MDGRTRRAGAVAAVTTIRNPILAARAVIERLRHVLLVGQGTEQFGREQGLAPVEAGYFFTQRCWAQLLRARTREAAETAADLTSGRVVAVALDVAGNLAATTSTGGMTNKRWGRIGDSPILGAGT